MPDISTEMSRTRRYRADVELGQAVIDAMDNAVAVFTQSGQLVMTNAAYADLWGHDPAATLTENSFAILSGWWRDQSAPTGLWSEAESFQATMGPRGECRGDVRLSDGRMINCRFTPLQGGATLASFRLVDTRNSPAPSTGQRRLKSA